MKSATTMTGKISEYGFEKIRQAISNIKRYHEQLVILIGDSASQLLQGVADVDDLIVINVGLELASGLLEIPSIDRPKVASTLFTELVEQKKNQPLLLDHLEILFDRSLSIDPLKLLKSVAKNRTVLAAWPGKKFTSSLIYAIPSHPEYRSYKESELNEVIFIEADKI
jgi:hypothetical protein